MKNLSIILILVLIVGCKNPAASKSNPASNAVDAVPDATITKPNKETTTIGEENSQEKCSPYPSNPNPIFTTHLLDLSKVRVIAPLGMPFGEIKGHTYIAVKANTVAALYAPTKLYLESLAYYNEQGNLGYILTFRISCEVWLILDHVKTLRPDLAALWIGDPAADTQSAIKLQTPFQIEEGELIGYTQPRDNSSAALDVGVYNKTRTTNFANPSRIRTGNGINEFSRKLNSTCPYEYFSSNLKSGYLSLLGSITDNSGSNVSCGSSSRDAKGTIAGEWYLANKNSLNADLAIASEPNGTVRVVGLELATSILDFSATEPETIHVGEETCYSNGSRYTYLQLISENRLEVAQGVGSCPNDDSNILDEDFQVYVR